jgi:ribosome-associated toxin RatA of RatAB toxin-antitoxin module
MTGDAGAGLVRAGVVGTAAFAASAATATAAPGALAVAAAVVALAYFGVGCVLMLAAFALAVSRSRDEVIAVGGLYFLAGCAPSPVRRTLMGALAVQVIVAGVTASVRPFTPLAFGVLVPVYGLGVAGFWAARHGTFPPRQTLDGPFEVVTDFAHYPTWVEDIKHVEVLERDTQGRSAAVRFRAAAMGRSTTYTLRYDFESAPESVSWVLVEGDLMRQLDGTYEFHPLDGDPDRTEVVYRLTVELIVPLPAFVKRRAESKIMHNALRELKDHVEGAER